MAYTTINKPSDYFNTKLYTGNGSTQSITGVGFQPDLTWIKSRNMNYDQNLFDVIRGTTKRLQANFASAETTVANSVTAFGTDGFTVGSDAGVNGVHTFASWNWLGANGTAANTDGSISSTVSASATSGFSIVSFTGTGSTATVGHGLGVTPKMFIVKNRSISEEWRPYHVALGGGQALALNATNATDTDASYWSNTNPTSSVFTVGTNTGTNGSGNSMIAYCFADVQGFSKFGSYTGNGNADGTFIYTGFKPAFVMVKRTDAIGNWVMVDSKRDTFNVCDAVVSADTSDAEYDVDVEDFLSNGFKMRDAHTTRNALGGTYIYMAFAEEPLVGTNPATAR